MSNVKSEFYNLKKVESNFTKKYPGSWYMIEINPLPIKKEILLVISDLIRGNTVAFSQDCRVEHYIKCRASGHTLPKELKKSINQVINEIEDILYKVLIKEPSFNIASGDYNEYSGQPLVFILEPFISFDSYSDHPHLNPLTHKIYPTSVCYTDEYDRLKLMEMSDKIDFAIRQTTIWLLKHMFWENLKKINSIESWLGPDADRVKEHIRYFFINPLGSCYCGSNKIFRDCCLSSLHTKMFKKTITNTDIDQLQLKWDEHSKFETEFRNHFLSLKT